MKSDKPTVQTIGIPEIARAVGCDIKTVRGYLSDLPVHRAVGGHYRFEASRLPELVALCQQKRKRKCLNRYNMPQSPEASHANS